MFDTRKVTALLGTLQIALIALFIGGTTYDSTEYSPPEYVIFRDIMVMLLLGFGFLMTFLRFYGLGAVGFTLMLTVIAIQLNILVEEFCRFIYGGSSDAEFPIHLSIPSFIDGEFSAATLLISYGAVIGRASPFQLLIMALFQSFFYALNKVVIVFGLLEAEDVGGTITIHVFGAYFGLAVSRALGTPKPHSASNADPTAISDVFSLIGTTLLWVYWPSFVGATETSNPANENACILHTILALLGSTGATFFFSHFLLQGKFHPVHVANATLAGGVAVGASARLEMTPGGALVLGVVAGVVSVYGYVYSTPFLEQRLRLYDTAGVHNLHGLPGLLGGIASAIFVTLDSDADFLEHGRPAQAGRQMGAVLSTIAVSAVTGLITGYVMKKTATETPEEYHDAMWWEAEYFEELEVLKEDTSVKSRASVQPVMDPEVPTVAGDV